MIKITCNRRLGDIEREALVAEAKMMYYLQENSSWVGDGMLYRTTGRGVYHFVDQKYEEGAR